MCGRYTLHTEKQALAERFDFDPGDLAGGIWESLLATLARDSHEAFGVYLDMRDKEIASMMAKCSDEEREKVVVAKVFVLKELFVIDVVFVGDDVR